MFYWFAVRSRLLRTDWTLSMNILFFYESTAKFGSRLLSNVYPRSVLQEWGDWFVCLHVYKVVKQVDGWYRVRFEVNTFNRRHEYKISRDIIRSTASYSAQVWLSRNQAQHWIFLRFPWSMLSQSSILKPHCRTDSSSSALTTQSLVYRWTYIWCLH